MLNLVKEKYANKDGKLKIIAGFSHHKDSKENIKTISAHSQEIYFVQCENLRAAKSFDLINLAKTLENKGTNYKIISNGNIQETIKKVIQNSNQNDTIVICGSFYIMADARNSLGFNEYVDPKIVY